MSLDEEDGPAWMNEGNDENHSLLFGSQDGESDSKQGYGSVTQEDDEGAKTTVSNTTQASESGVIEGPKRNCILHCFHFIEGCGVLSCIFLAATQIIPLFFMPMDEVNPGGLVLKFYISIFCLVFILVEYDAPIGFLKDSMILQNYVSRGFIYTFLGVSALEEAYSERVQDAVGHERDEFHVSWLGVFMQVSAWMIFGVGLIYMLLGLCCLKKLRDKLKEDDRKKWIEFREAKKILKKYQK